MLAIFVLMALPALASANFVYWANAHTAGSGTIGRAKLNGQAPNNNLITGLNGPFGVAVDSHYIYWDQIMSVGRANLDGSSPNPTFIPTSAVEPGGIAVTSSTIYYANGPNTIGTANINGGSPIPSAISAPGVCGIAVDSNFVYWGNPSAGKIGRTPVGGGTPDPNFITGISNNCGIAVDAGFIYWPTTSNAIARTPIAGGNSSTSFVPNAVPAPSNSCGVAVNPQYVFWGSNSLNSNNPLGRANINGTSPNASLVPGPEACLLAAAPANKITINSVTRKKKKGTAAINAKVPGPGQLTLDQTSTPPDANAVASAVKQVGLTLNAAGSFTLPVKPIGKTAKKLKKQVKKKGRAKVKQRVFIHFVPSGVTGVPNDQAVTVTLIKQGKRKHKK